MLFSSSNVPLTGCTVCEAISEFISNSSWTSVVNIWFWVYLWILCSADWLIIRIGWTNLSLNWIEIKLQLSSKFRLCNLPSSKDFNENKTVARKDELGPGSKSCGWVKCLAGTSHLPHKTEVCLSVSQWSTGGFYILFLPWQCPGPREVGEV